MFNDEDIIRFAGAFMVFIGGMQFYSFLSTGVKPQTTNKPHVTITVPVKAQKILEGLAERGVDEVGITIDLDEKL